LAKEYRLTYSEKCHTKTSNEIIICIYTNQHFSFRKGTH